jgi:hypothetical protein
VNHAFLEPSAAPCPEMRKARAKHLIAPRKSYSSWQRELGRRVSVKSLGGHTNKNFPQGAQEWREKIRSMRVMRCYFNRSAFMAHLEEIEGEHQLILARALSRAGV